MQNKCNQIDTLVGNQIRKIREDRLLTIDCLADKLDLSTVLLQRIESGKKRASAKMIFNLCDALNARPNEIYAFTK